jgi:hypothetical protein
MKLLPCCLGVVLVSFLLVGCNVNRNLKVTEVAADRVELFLDEPADKELNLSGIKLKWVSQDPNAQPVSGELDLGVAGPLRGRQFLVVFEDATYTDPPVAQPIGTGSTLGIKVRGGFFPGYITGTSVSMGVSGTNTRGLFFVPAYYHHADDVLRFGPRPRPLLAGVFQENGSLDTIGPEGGRESVSRTFAGADPVDSDSEADWSLRPNSIGVPTPP